MTPETLKVYGPAVVKTHGDYIDRVWEGHLLHCLVAGHDCVRCPNCGIYISGEKRNEICNAL